MFCGKCGKEFDETERFCAGCGTPNSAFERLERLNDNDMSQDDEETIIINEAKPVDEKVIQPIKKKSNKKKTVILIAIFVVAIVGTIGFLFVKNRMDKKELKKQLELGEKYYAELEYDKAIAAYDKAIEINSKSVEAYIGKGKTYKAIVDMEMFDSENPDSANEYMEKSLDAYEKAVKIDHNSVEASLGAADGYIYLAEDYYRDWVTEETYCKVEANYIKALDILYKNEMQSSSIDSKIVEVEALWDETDEELIEYCEEEGKSLPERKIREKRTRSIKKSTKSKDSDKNCKELVFSKEYGINLAEWSNVACQTGGYNEIIVNSSGRPSSDSSIAEYGDFIEQTYYEVVNGKRTDKVINVEDVTCLIGKGRGDVEIKNSDLTEEERRHIAFSRIWGSSGLFINKNLIKTNRDVVDCISMAYGDTAPGQGEDDLVGVELTFIGGYRYDGITPSSSKQEIVDAGFVESSMSDVYFKVVSSKGNDWNTLKKDFKNVYSYNNSNEYVRGHGYEGVDYGWELYRTRFCFNNPISANDKRRDYSLGEDYEESFENWKYDAQMGPKIDKSRMAQGVNLQYKYNWDEIVPQECAIAKQWYYLNRGEIDYFVVVEIEAQDEIVDDYRNRGPAYREFTYPQNVCHVYLFSHKDTVLKWLDQWGF